MATDFPPTGQLQPNTTYALRSELDLRGNASLSLTGAPEGGSLLDCRTSSCFSVGENASLSLASLAFTGRFLSALVRTLGGQSAGSAANECKIRLFNTMAAASSPVSPLVVVDLVTLAAGIRADVEFDGIGSASAPIPMRGLITQSTGSANAVSFARVRVSRAFVECQYGACISLGNATLSVAQSAFSYTYNAEQGPVQLVLQVPANNGASDAAVSIVDSSFSLLQLQFSGVRSVEVNGTSLIASSLSATLKPAGVLSMSNCNVSFNPITGIGNSLIKFDGPSSVLKITGINATGSIPSYDNFDLVEVGSAAVNSSVTISDVRATRLSNVLSYNTRLQMGSQSATLTGLRVVNAGVVNGRCPAVLSVRQVEAINATDRTLIDVDASFAATVDVRDIVTDRNGGTILRFTSTFDGNLTVRNVTVTASPTMRAIVQLSGSAANSQVTMSDIAVVGGRVVGSLFAQPNTGSVALSRITVRGSTTTAILLRTVNGTVDGFDVTNAILGAPAFTFSGGGTVLRNFKATDCTISASNPVVQFSTPGQFSTPWQMSNILFRNVTTVNGALIEFDTRVGRVDANVTAAITDVTIQNCTSRFGIRWSSSTFYPSTMAGWHVTLERINAVELVGGMIEFNNVYGGSIPTQYTWSDSLRLNSIRADRVSGSLARVALLSDFIVTDLRATNCDFVCDPQGSRALVVLNARTVLLSNVVLADNRGCNMTSTPNDANVWLQIVSGGVNVTDCAFERLTGGALGSLALIDVPQASLTRTRFDGNRGASALIAQTSQSSSAILLSVNDGFFRNNSASTGAAIRATNTHLLVRGSRFYDNAALTDGGAIHLTCCESKLIVGESLFRGNRAGTTGAAVFSSTNSASLAQVDIVENVVADGRANATGAIVHMRGLSASASVDMSRLTVARNVAGVNASVVDVSGAKTVVATDVCACGNSANESAEAAAIVCRMSPSTFLSLSSVVAATTAGCMADNSMLQPCTSSGCALRVPMLQADPPTPAPPTPSPTPQPLSPSPPLSSSSSSSGGGGSVTTIASGDGSTTSPLPGSGGAISDGEADIGLIVGAAVGGCVGLLLLIALIVFCVARRRRQGQNGPSAAPHETEMATARDEGNVGGGGSINGGGSIGAPSSSHYGSTFLSTPSSAASASGGNQHYRDMDMRQQEPQEAPASTYGDLRISNAYQSPAGAAQQIQQQQQQQQQQHGVYNNW